MSNILSQLKKQLADEKFQEDFIKCALKRNRWLLTDEWHESIELFLNNEKNENKDEKTNE